MMNKRSRVLIKLKIMSVLGKNHEKAKVLRKSGLFKHYGTGGNWHPDWIPSFPDYISVILPGHFLSCSFPASSCRIVDVDPRLIVIDKHMKTKAPAAVFDGICFHLNASGKKLRPLKIRRDAVEHVIIIMFKRAFVNTFVYG